jgi:hypothetical protein
MDGWIADELPEAYYEPSDMRHGSHWETTGGDETIPDVKHPIGFMRRKPRVRVKAWTMPIIPKNPGEH